MRAKEKGMKFTFGHKKALPMVRENNIHRTGHHFV